MSKADRTDQLETLCNLYRRTLQKVPHSRGDHTDLCRMKNEGQPPTNPKKCHCHVELVSSVLQVKMPT